ncbi:MAG: hypothetical protein A3K19_16810 [Lentisphaerae bacterium RIFOXYB12_FULL_65_16]|nr:MAG: hypothetical protein A3K18_19435 [Lentisphaerae bacterium RIFOXYA12_64_32]OGV88979.1 MAG: hypothetical protein A3K19_16810 [Lentisphaerae bacterium RIFOXYB12_FULL_65_16]
MARKDRPKAAATVRYHLRFQIIPGANVESDARDLVAFCRKHGVDEVVLFFAAEEWNNGLLSQADEDTWFETVAKAKAILDKDGISVSLNPWMTVLHCDRGRSFPADRPFRPCVSPVGEVSKACASFADPKWREYIYALYGRFAKLGFRVLWVEDDFRYHNHGPLTWGGGFEQEIVDRFNRRTGQRVTRDLIVRTILRPGKPHPLRAHWMTTWRECQLEVAQGLAQSVAQNAPGESKLGLMSSSPFTHGAEGRDWQKLFANLSIKGQVAHRPHYAPYGDAPGRDKIYSIMMLDLQREFRPDGCEVAPEVENFPFTAWSKSDTQTWAEMALCMIYGSDALLLDIFPFSGNPASAEPEIGVMLDRSQPALTWLAARFKRESATTGVGLPWREDAQTFVRTEAGRSMCELDASSFLPGNLLLPCGVPVAARFEKVNAVFGTLAWGFTEDELLKMLKGGLLLDGVSARILVERGLGKHLGVDVKTVVDREAATYAVEKVVAKESGALPGFFMNANLIPRMAVVEPRSGAKEWTQILTPDGKRFGAGLVTFRNARGGRVGVWAHSNPGALPRSNQLQKMVQHLVQFLAGGKLPAATVTGGPHLLPIHLQEGKHHRVAILNGSPDPAVPQVRLPGSPGQDLAATLLAPLAAPKSVRVKAKQEQGAWTVTPATELPYLGFLVLEW